MKRQQSLEDYLETILMLKNRLGLVRSIDIVKELNFSKPSVSIAMKNLREKEYIIMDKDGYISLTSEGNEIASRVYERHTILTQVLIKLGVNENVAKEDACMVEHDLSEETFSKIKEFVNNHN